MQMCIQLKLARSEQVQGLKVGASFEQLIVRSESRWVKAQP
jgi:hypothetical protein